MFSHCRVAVESVQKNSASDDGECSSEGTFVSIHCCSDSEMLMSVLGEDNLGNFER